MTATPYLLPRETRESTVLAGNGTVGPYGPSSYKIFDIEDVRVFAKALGDTVFSDVTDAVTIAKVTPTAAYDYFTVTFDASIPVTTAWYHQARRVAERSVAVTRGGTLDSNQLEKELSKQATVESEVRRDLDRAVMVEVGTDPIVIIPGVDGELAKFENGNVVGSGENVDTIEGATAAAAASAAAAAAQAGIATTQAGIATAAAAVLTAFLATISAFWGTVLQTATYAEAWLVLKLNGSLSTRTLIKALTPQAGMSVLLTEARMTGNFVWTLGDFSTQIAADTLGGIYLKADSVAATVGAWVRQYDGSIWATWFGALCDGVANDTAALQAAEVMRRLVGGDVGVRGDILSDGVVVNRPNGGSWRAIGNCRFLANANNVILMDVTGAVVSSTLSKVFAVEGIEFHFNAKTGVTGYREAASYLTRLSRIKINRLQFAALFTGPNAVTQTGWITISDVDQIGEGSWLFRAFDDTKYIFNININNFNQQGTGAAPWTGVNALFHFQRAVSAYLNNINAASLDGATKGVYMQGDCQGIFLNNVIIGWPTYGIHAVTWTDGVRPAYVYMNNVGIDQPTVSAYDINGRTWRIRNANATNGYLRGSTGPGVNIQATASDIMIKDFLAAYMNHDGIKVNVGATKVILAGVTAENNNQNAGGNFEVNLTSCTWIDAILEDRNYIGAAGVNATGQRVVNGTTSKEVSRNTGSASTTAVTTQEDLMTYTIPASVLKPGQKVRLTAWGTTAANANGKTVRLWFGGNSVIDHNGTWNATPWRITADILITGASTQEYNGVCFPTALVQTVRQGTLTVTDTAAIIVKATGQNAVANAGDINCQGFTVEIID